MSTRPLNETRVFVTLIVSVDGAKGGHRQFNTVLHGLEHIERVIGQSAAGMAESELSLLARAQDRYAEYVRECLKGPDQTGTNKDAGAGRGPAGQAAQADEGVTERKLPTGAEATSTKDTTALPDDAASPALQRRLRIAEHVLVGHERHPVGKVDVRLTLSGLDFKGSFLCPLYPSGYPATGRFLLELRYLMGEFAETPQGVFLASKLSHDEIPVPDGQKPRGRIRCEDQVVGVWESSAI